MVLDSKGYALEFPNVYTAISAQPDIPTLVTAFKNALVAGGWTLISTITNGYKLGGLSSQGLTVYCDIWKDAPYGYDAAAFRLHSAVGSVVGREHVIDWGSTFTWQVIAHPAGFAISSPGITYRPRGSSVIGGIPRYGTDCGLSAAIAIAELWFSFGDAANSPFFPSNCPRRNLDIGDGIGNFGCACQNGVLYAGTGWDQPMILRLSQAGTDVSGHAILEDTSDLIYPAYLAFPDSSGQPTKIRGQLINAACWSGPHAMDGVFARDNYNWMMYTDLYRWGTLAIMRSNGSTAGTLCNLAY